MNTPQNPPQRQSLCRKLRNKEMYYQSPGEENDACASGIFWCTQTHEGFGPDGQPVGKTECCAGRPCYVD